MKKAYVLYCSVWGGNSYETELTCIYLNYKLADQRAKELQGNYCTSDVEYRVEEVNIEDFDWEIASEQH